MTSHRTSVAIVGIGEVGKLHCHAANSSPLVDLVAAVDPDPQQRDFIDRLGATAFDSMEAMLSKLRPELVCVTTPTSLHERQVLTAAAAGIDVLCEKPLTLDLGSARRMLEGCRSAGTRLFYGASYRHLQPISRARDLIAEGLVGEVLVVVEHLVGGAGASARIPQLGALHYPPGGPGGGGMGMVDHGIHLLDCIPWLVGKQIVSVFGRANIAGAEPAPEFASLELEGGAIAHLLYEDGTFPNALPAEGVFGRGREFGIAGLSTAGTWEPTPGTITVYGTRGTLRILHYAGYLFLSDRNGVREVPLANLHAPEHFRCQLELAVEDRRNGTFEAASGEDGIAALTALMAIYHSQKEGRAVDMREMSAAEAAA